MAFRYVCKKCKQNKSFRDKEGEKTCNEQYICKDCQDKEESAS